MRLSQSTVPESWFPYLLEDTLLPSNSSMFDKSCQQIQNKLFEFAMKTMIARNKDDVSFEFDLHEFHRSEEFLLICWEFLPGRLAYHHGGCVMLCISLSELFIEWLKTTMMDERKKRNPELFKKGKEECFTMAEQNNEVNSFIGWSIFSSLKKSKYVLKTEKESMGKKIILSMMMREKDIDEGYMAMCYDKNMAMVNHGFLILVKMDFSNWGRDLMRLVRSSLFEKDIDYDPKNCFDKVETAVMANTLIKSRFHKL